MSVDDAGHAFSGVESVGRPDAKFVHHSPTATKFTVPGITARGEMRARVPFRGYDTVWFNTGTLCNITCKNCYIESSPKNDRLAYLTRAEVREFLDEALSLRDRPAEIGFTGGEPFMNPDFVGMLEDALEHGFAVLVLTNATRPMQRRKDGLLALSRRFPGQLSIRVSLDHFEAAGHEELRGPRTWQPAIDGLTWLVENDFDVSISGRTVWGMTEREMRLGYALLFASLDLAIDADDPKRLVLFPEMEEDCDVPEISEGCWEKLGKSPSDVMCSNSRMVVRRKGSERASVVACTLLPYAPAFDLAASLDGARAPVSLNHRHCSRFCVLGGASCTGQK
ncbi:MAG: radical SAM protein [Hyphomicrobium sp.]|jgi:hypothetical protein